MAGEHIRYFICNLKDYETAYNLFKEAISLNNSKAYNSLGYMYYYGYYVEKNVKRAYDYFKSKAFLKYSFIHEG
jgi:TPR repeat protein